MNVRRAGEWTVYETDAEGEEELQTLAKHVEESDDIEATYQPAAGVLATRPEPDGHPGCVSGRYDLHDLLDELSLLAICLFAAIGMAYVWNRLV